MLRLVDVSEFTSHPDWQAIAAAGVIGAYVKGYGGNDGPNRYAEEQIAGARAAGLKVGVYHFAFVLPSDVGKPGRTPTEQVDALWQAVGALGPFDLPPMLDLEWPPPAEWPKWLVTSAIAAQWIAAALADMDARFGRQSGIYTAPGWWQALRGAGQLDAFARRPLWLADWLPAWTQTWPLDDTTVPTPPPPWAGGDVTLWQSTPQLSLGGEVLDGSVCDIIGWNRLTGSS
jgi:GH25 family lysozyme M1 (1,4-beta-N-acetylmuramidase)